MKIERKDYWIDIFAEEDRAIKRKDDTRTTSTCTSVCIPLSQDPNEWEDCEYGEEVRA